MSYQKINLTAKEKRLIRKENQRIMSIAWETIKKANSVLDPLAALKAFTKYQKNDLSVTFSVHRVIDLDEATIDIIFDIERDNMKQLYEDCDWGWHEKKKRDEMTDERGWYLIARDEGGNLVGFAYYKLDLDYDVEVLYLYELQLTPKVRRKGLGKFMLQIMELIAFRNDMKKVVLTVLKHNPGAVEFFTRMNYELDDSSPVDDAYESFHYMIMSKKNKRLQNND